MYTVRQSNVTSLLSGASD